MKNSTRQLLSALLLAMIFASCSRPVAHFQRGPVEHYNTPQTETVAAVMPAPVEVVQPAEAATTLPEVVATPAPAAPVAQARAAMTQIEAYVRNDQKLATDKKLNKRMDRVKTMLASATTNASSAPKVSRHMNAPELFMLKKINKNISKHLAPTNPDKAMINGGLLTGGIILALAGLLLIILTSGTAATIGVVALVIGALALILGLIAS